MEQAIGRTVLSLEGGAGASPLMERAIGGTVLSSEGSLSPQVGVLDRTDNDMLIKRAGQKGDGKEVAVELWDKCMLKVVVPLTQTTRCASPRGEKKPTPQLGCT